MTTQMRTARKAAGLTMAELAQRVGVTREYVVMLERGYRTPSLSVAARICGELPELSIADFLPTQGEGAKA